MIKILKVFISILVVFSLLGCESKKEELTIGMSPWPGYEPLVLALEMGYYNDTKVKIVRYPTPTESFKALRDGVVEVAAFTVDEVLNYSEVNTKPKIFLILDVSNGGDALIAKPDIKTLNDLKGKRIGAEPSALGDYLMSRVFDFADGVTREDVIVKPIEISSQPLAYKNNEVDALITYNPAKSIMMKDGAHVLFDSSKIPYEIVDVMIAHEQTIHNKKEALIDLKNGWFKALAYISKNKNKAMKQMAGYEHLSTVEFQESFNELLIPSLKENIEMLNKSNLKLHKSISRLSTLMYKKGTLSSKIQIDNLFTSDIVLGK